MKYNYIRPKHYKDATGKDTIARIQDKDGAFLAAQFCYGNCNKYHDRMGKKPNEPAERDKAKINEYACRAFLIERSQPKWRLWYWRKVLPYLIKL